MEFILGALIGFAIGAAFLFNHNLPELEGYILTYRSQKPGSKFRKTGVITYETKNVDALIEHCKRIRADRSA